MGNPHAVLIVNDINQEIESIAKTIQNSGDFPNGVNVNFVEITDKSNIYWQIPIFSLDTGQPCQTPLNHMFIQWTLRYILLFQTYMFSLSQSAAVQVSEIAPEVKILQVTRGC
jgi:hypothetical protein